MGEQEKKQRRKLFDENQVVMLGALLPMLYMAVFEQWAVSLPLLVISVVSCVLIFIVTDKIRKRGRSGIDLRGVTAGCALFITLTDRTPWYVPLVGAVLIGVIICIFDTDHVYMPVLLARCFLEMSMTAGFYGTMLPPAQRLYYGLEESVRDLFWGFSGGALGEICGAAILAGGIFLILYRKGTPVLSLSAAISGFVTLFLFGQHALQWEPALAGVMTGNYLFTVLFAVCEYRDVFLGSPKRRYTLQAAAGCLFGLLIAGFRIAGISKVGAYAAFLIVLPLIGYFLRKRTKAVSEAAIDGAKKSDTTPSYSWFLSSLILICSLVAFATAFMMLPEKRAEKLEKTDEQTIETVAGRYGQARRSEQDINDMQNLIEEGQAIQDIPVSAILEDVYEAYGDDGALEAIVVVARYSSVSGKELRFLTGIDKSGVIYEIRLLPSDTLPGGVRTVREETFLSQMAGKKESYFSYQEAIIMQTENVIMASSHLPATEAAVSAVNLSLACYEYCYPELSGITKGEGNE